MPEIRLVVNDRNGLETRILTLSIPKYGFKEQQDKAQELSNKLGFKTKMSKPMILTDIYNQEELEYKSINGITPIGFTRSS